ENPQGITYPRKLNVWFPHLHIIYNEDGVPIEVESSPTDEVTVLSFEQDLTDTIGYLPIDKYPLLSNEGATITKENYKYMDLTTALPEGEHFMYIGNAIGDARNASILIELSRTWGSIWYLDMETGDPIE